MFTGLVEEVGAVERRTDVHGATVLTVAATTVLESLRPGDSVAVAGVCLTVTTVDDRSFSADVMPESMRRTTLGTL